MSRRKQDPVLQKLRQLARAGKRREAADLLEQVIHGKPDHARARDELSRYLTGKPFSFEEADIRELKGIIADFLTTPQRISTLKNRALKRLRHRVAYLEQALSPLLDAADKKALQQLRSAITRDMQRRRKPMGKLGLSLAAGIGGLLCMGACGFFLWQSAGKAADDMHAFSQKNFEITTARNLLKIHDTGLNRTLNRRVGEEADRIRMLIKVTEQRAREVDSILTTIESGKQSVVSQGVRRRAFIERRLRELGKDGLSLHARWAELCRREQNELRQQRLSLVEELVTPLPEWQGVTGTPAEDISLLNARIKTLRQRINIYDDAAEALSLEEGIIRPAKEELRRATTLLKEITALQHMLELLPSAHEYTRYRELLSQFKPEHYHPALELMDVQKHIPTVASIRGLMQEYGQNLPPGLLQAARESLLEGKPSFSTNFAATREQLHLLDELLTNSALSTRLYELTNLADGEEAYSEELPVLRYGRACFQRSALDPQREVHERKAVEWQNPGSVVTRTLDPRPLHRELKLDNKTGFTSTTNMPALITRLLQHEHKDVPPLAKAYVFHYLLRVLNAAEHSIMSGLRYAPEMRRAIESFEKLRKECNVKLDGSCWLRRSPAHTAAEQKYGNWFHKHRKIDFAAEIKANLGKLLSVTPRFAGYINERGEPVLFEQVRDAQLIWYLSGSAMTTSPWGEELQKPVPLSPVFIMDR